MSLYRVILTDGKHDEPCFINSLDDDIEAVVTAAKGEWYDTFDHHPDVLLVQVFSTSTQRWEKVTI